MLSIRLARKPDGSAVLHCARPDGSQTWQRHRKHADFFPLHDLWHFAVETTLGLRYGFYGLLASGWNITDFGARPIPEHAAAEAQLAEHAVNLLTTEQAAGHRYDAGGFNEALSAALRQAGGTLDRPVTDEELDAIRALWMQLAVRWSRVPPGGEMEITFDGTPARAS